MRNACTLMVGPSRACASTYSLFDHLNVSSVQCRSIVEWTHIQGQLNGRHVIVGRFVDDGDCVHRALGRKSQTYINIRGRSCWRARADRVEVRVIRALVTCESCVQSVPSHVPGAAISIRLANLSELFILKFLWQGGFLGSAPI